MKFFRNMTQSEKSHWDKGVVFGFYIFLFLLFIDHSHNLIFGRDLLSSFAIFWIGIGAAWIYSLILDKRRSKQNESGTG
ncbi:hypothetical protein [Rossellomorea vietnamensis]|uniref:hypothetical protein n=1 Tax=Rossellomorea vietnamensis TaxID=218284 RepID=UPI0016536718|nr:hypothetical protein [Rossellomorea vietnamensis]